MQDGCLAPFWKNGTDVIICDLLAFGAVLLGRAREARAVLAHLGVVARVGGIALDLGTHLLPIIRMP